MTMLVFVLLGLLIGFFRAGGISGLARTPLRQPWLLVVALAMQAALMIAGPLVPGFFVGKMVLVQVLRFLPLLLFVAFNARDWRIDVAGLGVALNATVILANGGQMPVHWMVRDMPVLAQSVQQILGGSVPDYMIMTGAGSARLWVLGDLLAYPVFQTVGFASVGDLVLGLGVLLWLQHAMVRYAAGRHVRGSLAREPRVFERKPEPVMEAPIAPAAAGRVEAPAEEVIPLGRHAIEKQPLPVGQAEPVPQPNHEPGPQPLDAHPVAEPMRLSPRLQTIATLVEGDSRVADIGADHGKLAVHLAQRGTPVVIATDISADSLAKTQMLVRERGLEDRVYCRLGDGLRKLRPGEVDTIVIAGMGGPTICAILDEGRRVTDTVGKLVLQPMNAIGTVRRWLAENGFALASEELVEDDGRLYQILCAVPGAEPALPETLFDLEIGRLLVERQHPLLGRLLLDRIATIDGILEEIAAIDSPKANARRLELMELRRCCEEALP